MKRIVLDIQDDQKADMLLSLFQDLNYVQMNIDGEKVWNGYLPVFDDPVTLPEFVDYSREALHER